MPIQDKRGVIISLDDGVLELSSPKYLDEELVYQDILIGSGYPKEMICQTIEKK